MHSFNRSFIHVFIFFFFFFVFYSVSTQPTHHAGSNRHGPEANMGFDNQAFRQTNSIPANEPEYLEIGELQQPSVGFSNPSFDSGDHYQAINNGTGGPKNTYEELNFSIQSQA